MDKYQLESKRISKELSSLSKKYKSKGIENYHNVARCEINKKYGKGWREALDLKSLIEFPDNHKKRFDKFKNY